jgi:hypothetical protein
MSETITLSAQANTDTSSARVTMKDAAKCDKRCEWQNPANQENAERILRFQVTPESIFGSGHLYFYAASMIITC